MALIEDGAPLEEILKDLDSAGVSPLWSEFSQTVYLSNFVTTTRISLSQAQKRLLPSDPRRTPWLDHLLDYYVVEDGAAKWHLVYYPRRYTSRAADVLERLWKKTPWRIIYGSPSIPWGLLWMPALAMVAVFAFRSPHSVPLLLYAALPWIPLWLSEDLTASLAGLMGYLGLTTWLLENESRSWGAPRGITWDTLERVVPPIVSFVLIAVSDPPILPSALLSSLAAFAVILAVESRHQRLERRQAHAVFRGWTLDLTRAEEKRRSAMRDRTGVVILCASLMCILDWAFPSGSREPLSSGLGTLSIPAPGKSVADDPVTAETIARLVKERLPDQLPDLSDAVAHRVFQEAIPYSRVGTRVYGDLEPATMERYSTNGIRVQSRQEMVLDFNDEWIRQAALEEANEGIGEVLRDQGGLPRVEKRRVLTSTSHGSLALKDVFFYIMLFAPAGLGLVRRNRRIESIGRKPARSAIL